MKPLLAIIVKILPEPIRYILRQLSFTIKYYYDLPKRRQILNQLLLIKKPGKSNIDYSLFINDIHLSGCYNPKVSIIICVFNKLSYTLNCLYSLSVFKNKVPFEVILVDDCSTEENINNLKDICHLKYFRNIKNVGFLKSSNFGATKAKGEYLVFLNNDTVVCDYWLDNLIHYLEANKTVGIAGSKLLYPDGSLQEAGAFIFSDGSGWNYGRNECPSDFRFNYCREVDYCSGSSIAVNKELFFKIGKFDERFSPCYYEDTDLAFKMRQEGFQVHYVSTSLVFHFEGISHGKNIKLGPKRFQKINNKKFKDKWEVELIKHPDKSRVTKKSIWVLTKKNKKRILIVDYRIPKIDHDSGSFRIYQIMRILSKSFCVTFWPINLRYEKKYYEMLEEIGVECLNNNSRMRIFYFIKQFGLDFDFVILCRPDIAFENIKFIKRYCPNAKIIYDTVDLHYLRLKRQAEIIKDRKDKKYAYKLSRKYFEIEISNIKNSHLTWVVTDTEKEHISKLVENSNFQVIPNIHPTQEIKNKDFDKTKNVLFVGGFEHPPNVDSVQYLISNIWPKVSQQIEDVKLIIIGSNPTKKILDLADNNIIVKGYTPKIEPELVKARVFVAPLRYGAGMKGKIGQALSFGIPTVTTSIGSEGFGFLGDELIIEDDPESIANAIVKLYTNKEIWHKYQHKGWEFMKRFTPEQVEKKLMKSLLLNEGIA